MKKTFIALTTASVLTLSACSGGSSNSAPSASNSTDAAIVATTNVYGNIAETLAGGHVKVKSLITDPSQDPHDFKASSQDQLAISNAKVVIENGNGYDDFGQQMVQASPNKPQVIDVQSFAPAGDNEHYWYDMPTMVKLTDQITAKLKEIDPAHANDFDANATKMKSDLSGIEGQEASLKSAHNGQGVLITEPVPLYMLQASGFVNKTPEEFSEAVENGNETSAAVLNQTLGLATPEQVKFLALNDQTLDSQSTTLKQKAEQNKLPIVNFTETLPEGKSYVEWMKDNVEHIEGAVK